MGVQNTIENPIQTLTGNLLFSAHGTWWATYRLQGLAYGRRPDAEKESIRALHQGLYRALGGESLHLGLAVDTDPVTVVQRMLHNLEQPLEQLPEWTAECEATLDRLEDDVVLGERTYWLAVPLRGTGSEALIEPLRAVWTWFLTIIGFPRLPPSQRMLAERRRRADEVMRLIPAPFRPRPATAAEQAWIYAHALHRGLATDPWLPPTAADAGTSDAATFDRQQAPDPADKDLPAAPTAASLLAGGALGEPLIDEGALSDVPEEGWRRGWRQRLRQLKPAERRVLKVIDADRDTASYQSMLVLAGTPDGGAVFPGTEWLGHVENAGVPVDWAVRMRNNAREAVLGRNRRAVTRLNEQYEQRAGETTTGAHELDATGELLTEYQRRLATEKSEVELETITCFSTAAETRDQALAQGDALVAWFASFEHRLARPLGEQADTWWAMQPGAAWPRKLADFTQISLSEGFAAAVPMMSTVLGDRHGTPLALNQTTRAQSVVFLDLFGTIAADFSGCVAVAGELGSGKSYTMKSIAGAECDRGANIIAIDSSGTGEYVDFARSLGDCEIADVLNPQRSLDPLRILPGDEGATVARSLLVTLFNIVSTSADDTLLGRVLKQEYRHQNGITGLGSLTDHLINECLLAGGADLGYRLDAYRSEAFSAVLFDETLPPIRTDSRALIFWTHGLQLPTSSELNNAHLFAQLKIEKRFGRAIYAMLMGLSRRLAFADPTQKVVFLNDEMHRTTSSPEGLEETKTYVREARKELAAGIFGSQDCTNDFGDDTLKGLIPYRIVMRLTDKILAAAALTWIGLEATADLVKEVTQQLSPRDPHHPTGEVPAARRGEGLFRDSYGRIGRVKILGPALAARRKAYSTTATSRTADLPTDLTPLSTSTGDHTPGRIDAQVRPTSPASTAPASTAATASLQLSKPVMEPTSTTAVGHNPLMSTPASAPMGTPGPLTVANPAAERLRRIARSHVEAALARSRETTTAGSSAGDVHHRSVASGKGS
ncbi:ATP-binding protein [Kineococcus rhizosphaerae]|uniref:AAA domain-containing protein n=1 Tax=Kineococcus rhizosphaerae TaxID=559628 RepID=A0A2T0QWZ3_9ACTN|nr:ATP-binding protein [Kineococcus rhizosphaerae]PRY09923.1 AAA domain-containing protein [Kineococcus rhizosphaerae]